MPQKNIGQVRKFGAGLLQKLIAVGHGSKPAAVEIALNSVAIDGFPVPHMILGYHCVAEIIHIAGEFVIALYLLCNSVDDLQHGHRGLIRHPPADMDLPGSLGCIVFVGAHAGYSTTV